MENVVAGGFMSYGASLHELFRSGAPYVHKILQGTRLADLPVEQRMKFELIVKNHQGTQLQDSEVGAAARE